MVSALLSVRLTDILFTTFYIGIGGGLMNVAIFFFLLEFPYRTSVILSLCTLMGRNVLQAFINLDKSHPLSKSRPLIYWDAVLIILPSILCGKLY